LFRKILQQKLLHYQHGNIFQATLSHDSQRNFIKFLLQTETLWNHYSPKDLSCSNMEQFIGKLSTYHFSTYVNSSVHQTEKMFWLIRCLNFTTKAEMD
jgi:hypothetical protein